MIALSFTAVPSVISNMAAHQDMGPGMLSVTIVHGGVVARAQVSFIWVSSAQSPRWCDLSKFGSTEGMLRMRLQFSAQMAVSGSPYTRFLFKTWARWK